jgi:hypothetical protein
VSEALPPSLLRRVRNSWRLWRRGVYGTIDLIPDGFVYTRRGKAARILWNDVVRIDAGVLDLLTSDLVYVVVHTNSETFTIEEIVDGFRQLENATFEHWPDIQESWTALYKAPASQPRHETLLRIR